MMERLDAFMARANAEYYATHDPFADFTTSPEITQVFGELLGLWAAVAWQAMGSPAPVLLAEAGPGRGTLMADALRAVARMAPDFHAALRLHLIETSPRLRAQQAGRLPDATFHDGLASLPEGPLLLIANEFLDALPIRQFERAETGWTERYVRGGRVALVPSDLTFDAPVGAVMELGEAACAFAAAVARRVARDGGAALLIDYGPEHSALGDSLQALRNRAAADPLADPGHADLTAHVDFAALARAAVAAGGAVQGPLPQGVFLSRLGLFQRSGALARTQPPARASALLEAASRLAEPHAMGRLFKAMAICHPALPTLPGFAA